MVKFPTKQSNNNQKQRGNNRPQQHRTAHWKQNPRSHAEHSGGVQSTVDHLRTKGTEPLGGPPLPVNHSRPGLAELPSGSHYSAEDLRKVNPTLPSSQIKADTNKLFPESKSDQFTPTLHQIRGQKHGNPNHQ